MFTQLTSVLIRAVAYPESFTGWDSSDVSEDEFQRFREQGCDMLRSCAERLQENVLEVIVGTLSETQSAPGGQISWSQTEAVLFSAASIWREAHYDVTQVRQDYNVAHQTLSTLFSFICQGLK